MLILGTLTLPYICVLNGVFLSIIWILFGAIVSWYTGVLFILCSDKVNSTRFEEIALKVFGSKVKKLASWAIILTMLGFVMSFIVFIKAVIPQTLLLIIYGRVDFEDDPLPLIFGKGTYTG